MQLCQSSLSLQVDLPWLFLFHRSVMSNSFHPTDCSNASSPVLPHLLELLKLMSIESVMPSYCLVLCHPLLLLPSIFPSIRVFSSKWALHIRWLKYWNFIFNISPSSEYLEFISFRIGWLDWFHFLAVQGTLKSLRLAFFMSQHNEASVKT